MEESARVTITLKKSYFVHLLYWIIIIVLAILLINNWMKDCAPGEDTQDVAAGQDQAGSTGEALPPPAEPEPEPEPEETCSDGEKNQDETDVDCGGSCPGCSSGDRCDSPSDCVADYCVEGRCTSEEPVELSGELKITVTSVETEVNEGTGAAKVLELGYKIENGLEDSTGTILAKVYLKSKQDSSFCLNQPSGQERDCVDAYATFTLPSIDSGKDKSGTLNLDGRYVGASYVSNFGSDLYYENGDDFNLFMYLYEESGELIGGETVTGFKSVNP